jgi:phenylacetate-CoA ligase
MLAKSKVEDYLYKFLGLYKKMPLRLQHILGKIYNLLPRSFRYGIFYQEYCNRIKQWESGLFDEAALLSETFSYALNHIDYYKSANDDEKSFGVINKQIINSNKERFINHDLKSQLLKSNTGGTSGTPFEFYIHKGVGRAKEKAHFDWYWGKIGYNPGDKVLMIRGAPLKNGALYEYIAIDNKLSITCYDLNDDNVGGVVKAINRFKPKFIHGYPSALKILTLLVEKKKIKIENLKGLFLGSEYLDAQDRAYFEAYYNARVINWYGHSELLIHAGNCQYSNEYHIYPFYGHVEMVGDDGKIISSANTMGKIIATGFDNKVMPLIRYDTGDLAEYSDSTECQCGFHGKSFSKIYGREQNYIVLNDGTIVSVTAFIFGQHFDEFNKIREIQLLQSDIHNLIVHIVPNEIFSEKDVLQLADKMATSVNNKISISIEIVEKTKKTESGKHKILIQSPGLLDEYK